MQKIDRLLAVYEEVLPYIGSVFELGSLASGLWYAANLRHTKCCCLLWREAEESAATPMILSPWTPTDMLGSAIWRRCMPLALALAGVKEPRPAPV